MAAPLLAQLVDLTSTFTVVSYTGGVQEGYSKMGVANLFATEPRERAHCSKPGQCFDLVAVAPAEFTLTHVVLRGLRQAMAPVKSALVWISSQAPDVGATARWNAAAAQADAAALPTSTAAGPGPRDESAPVAYLETDAVSLQAAVELPRWVSGRFLHIKFLAAHPLGVRRREGGRPLLASVVEPCVFVLLLVFLSSP